MADTWSNHLCQCLETFFVITKARRVGGGGSYWHLVGGDQGRCSVPHRAQDAPHPRVTQPQMSVMPRLRSYMSRLLRFSYALNFTFIFKIYLEIMWVCVQLLHKRITSLPFSDTVMWWITMIDFYTMNYLCFLTASIISFFVFFILLKYSRFTMLC